MRLSMFRKEAVPLSPIAEVTNETLYHRSRRRLCARRALAIASRTFGVGGHVNGVLIPLWASVVACVVAAALAFMLYRESRS